VRCVFKAITIISNIASMLRAVPNLKIYW